MEADLETVVTNSPREAAQIIRAGGIVAFPTETVYGLGADVFNELAIQKLFEAKRRPSDNPLIVHVANREQIVQVVRVQPDAARRLMDAFFPGPLTLVLERSVDVPVVATAGLNTAGIRMPRHDVARRFLSACNTPVVAPSANLSGRPSPTNWRAVAEDLDGRIDCILKGEPTEIGLESTVVDCTVHPPVVLRLGAITLDQLRNVVPETRRIAQDETSTPRSPGLKHRHYSPAGRVLLFEKHEQIENAQSSAYIGIHDRTEPFLLKRICASVDEYAREVFEFFRECDRRGISVIYCEPASEEGIGAALMDRLHRASQV